MSYNFSTFGLIAGSIFTLLIFVSSQSPGSSNEKLNNNLPQQIQSAFENKQYSFAGEVMPDNFDNRERLNRELSVNAYWQSNTMLNMKKANRYFPLMEQILAEEGVPDDFKYLAVAESDLRHATSHANAKGFWQFRKAAGKEMGLEINDEVDERYHVARATRAAAKYLKRLRTRFGSWTNAAAAYNVGQGNFNAARTKQQEFSFFDMNMNIETNRYLFRLIAIKEIMKEPEKFGFYIQPNEKYPPLDNYYEVVVDSSVPSWSNFAKEKGITYRMLKVFNPWLIDNKLTVKNNIYHIRIPR